MIIFYVFTFSTVQPIIYNFITILSPTKLLFFLFLIFPPKWTANVLILYLSSLEAQVEKDKSKHLSILARIWTSDFSIDSPVQWPLNYHAPKEKSKPEMRQALVVIAWQDCQFYMLSSSSWNLNPEAVSGERPTQQNYNQPGIRGYGLSWVGLLDVRVVESQQAVDWSSSDLLPLCLLFHSGRLSTHC